MTPEEKIQDDWRHAVEIARQRLEAAQRTHARACAAAERKYFKAMTALKKSEGEKHD